jgi:hypothetical protein
VRTAAEFFAECRSHEFAEDSKRSLDYKCKQFRHANYLETPSSGELAVA